MKPQQLSDWAERAQAGEDVVYCTGVRPDETIGAAARALCESGVVTLTARRVAAESGGGFRFIAQRLADPRPSQIRARRRSNSGQFRQGQPASGDAKRTTRAVLRLLVQAANRDAPCPTNAEIAVRVGLTGSVAASYRMRRLVRDGMISVEEPGPCERRIVTIVATGKKTRRAML
ncbi:MAG: winged helix-turn-helix domain-containing protein [Sphingobium sp.]|nr:winged helix-turn-helix domain-containing protein [Sphingobium sp.]